MLKLNLICDICGKEITYTTISEKMYVPSPQRQIISDSYSVKIQHNRIDELEKNYEICDECFNKICSELNKFKKE